MAKGSKREESAKGVKRFENTTKLFDKLLKGKEAVYIGGPGSGVFFDVTPVDIWRRMNKREGEDVKNMILLDRRVGTMIDREVREDIRKKEKTTAGDGGLSNYRESLHNFFKERGFGEDLERLDRKTMYYPQDLARMKVTADEKSLFIDHGTLEFVLKTEIEEMLGKIENREYADEELWGIIKEHAGENKEIFRKLKESLPRFAPTTSELREPILKKIIKNYLDNIANGCVFFLSEETGNALRNACTQAGIPHEEYEIEKDAVDFPTEDDPAGYAESLYQLKKVFVWNKKRKA